MTWSIFLQGGIWDGATMSFFPSTVALQHSTESFIRGLTTTTTGLRTLQVMISGQMTSSIQLTMEHIHR